LIQEVILGYYLYEVTGDPLVLGLIGLFEAIPYLALALFGGYIADRFDKKKVAQICITAMIFISFYLINVVEQIGVNTVGKWYIYLAIFSIGVARGFLGPSWSSIKAFLVKEKHYSNAASWSSQFWQSGMILGPASAGFLYAYLGLINTLYLVIALFFIALLSATLIKKKSKITFNKNQKIFESLKEGFQFVKNSRVMLYAISLDMFSVLFGGVVAILPVFAKDILHVGPQELGIMRATPGIGAVITMFTTAFYPPTRRAWRNMLLAVVGFGLATLVFAISKNYYLSLVALFITGACDSISVVVRQTIMQLLPPNEMRGRVNAINGVFVSCSNELGAFESGLAAKLLGPVNSVLFGASVTLGIIAVIYYRTRDLLTINLLEYKKDE
jgi:MFS family permease